MAMSKKRKAIFDKSGGQCWYCGCELPEKGWHEDHFVPIIRRVVTVGFRDEEVKLNNRTFKRSHPIHETQIQNPEMDCFENLVPSCSPCNLMKSDHDIEGFRNLLIDQKRLFMKKAHFRNAAKFGVFSLNDSPVVFWFEQQNQ